MHKMLNNFTGYDLAIVALSLEGENEENRKSFEENKGKRRVWVHSGRKKRSAEGEFSTLSPRLLEDETKFYQYFRLGTETP